MGVRGMRRFANFEFLIGLAIRDSARLLHQGQPTGCVWGNGEMHGKSRGQGDRRCLPPDAFTTTWIS